VTGAYETPERTLLRDQVARFVERDVEPHGDAWERAGSVPRGVIRQLGALGWLGLMVPEAYGGADVDALTNFAFAEALSMSTYGGFVVTVLVHTDMASPHLVNAGTDEQKARWLPAIVRGDALTAVAVTEAGAGSDVAGIRTTARRDGDAFVLDGSKLFITNGVHADLYVVAARTAPLSEGSRGVSVFVVEKGTPGFRVGQVLDKAGWRSSDTAELVFEGCRIPASHLLGVENQGFRALMRNFQRERLALAAMAIGNASQALALALAHVRVSLGFGSALWHRVAIRQ
jgi:acyl-CoA dehydrogenase